MIIKFTLKKDGKTEENEIKLPAVVAPFKDKIIEAIQQWSGDFSKAFNDADTKLTSITIQK